MACCALEIFNFFSVDIKHFKSYQSRILYNIMIVHVFFPIVRANLSIGSKVAYVKFTEPHNVSVALHLTNTVFVDRALIVVPVMDGKLFLLLQFFVLFSIFYLSLKL